MLTPVLSVLSILFGTALTAKPPSYQGGDDPYPVQRYIGTKQQLTGSSRYPQAMSHERDRNGPNAAGGGKPIAKSTHFEPLFDDFPGPKTKQRIYYPGKGYVNMQVPVQQPDPYTDGKPKNYQSGAYDPKVYQAGAYDALNDNDGPSPGAPAAAQHSSYSPPSYRSRPQPSYSPPPAQPSYSAPSAPTAPTDYSHEDDDSPFDYLSKRGGGSSGSGYGQQASSYRPSPPAQSYQSSPPAYRQPFAPAPSYKSNYQPPAQPSYRPSSPPRPSYGAGQSASAPAVRGHSGSSSGNGQAYSQANGKSFFSYNENKGKPYVISQKPDVSIVTGAGGDAGYSAGYSGGNEDNQEVGLQSYNPPLPSNPSGYVPSGAYPSSYPDTKSSASMYSQTAAEPAAPFFGGGSGGGQQQQDSPVDGLSSSFGARSYFEGGNRPQSRGYDAHSRGFYDLAEQPNGSGGQGPQAGPFKK